MDRNNGFLNQERNIPANNDYDVVIVGGGVAGMAAAIAAARNGAKTLIIEKSNIPGGLATLGVVPIYLPLCDGMGTKIMGGLADELLQLSIKYGYNSLAPEWLNGNRKMTKDDPRYETFFSPAEFVTAMDEALEKEGVDVIYDCLFCDAIAKDGNCEAVIIEQKEGPRAYFAKVFIDASGDAAVFDRVGAETIEGDNWLSYWVQSVSLRNVKTAIEKNDIRYAVKLKCYGAEADGKFRVEGHKKYLGTKSDEINEFIKNGRRLLLEDLKNKEKNSQECIVTLPGMPQFRTIRHIKSMYDLNDENMNCPFEDSIGIIGNWRKRGPVYEIPFRSLISEDVGNILAAGRCIGADGEAWEMTRVIPAAALSGEAAGVAAGLCAKNKTDVRQADIERIKAILKENGIIIHKEQLG